MGVTRVPGSGQVRAPHLLAGPLQLLTCQKGIAWRGPPKAIYLWRGHGAAGTCDQGCILSGGRSLRGSWHHAARTDTSTAAQLATETQVGCCDPLPHLRDPPRQAAPWGTPQGPYKRGPGSWVRNSRGPVSPSPGTDSGHWFQRHGRLGRPVPGAPRGLWAVGDQRLFSLL